MSVHPSYVTGKLHGDIFPKVKAPVRGRGFVTIDGEIRQVRLDFSDAGEKLSWSDIPEFPEDVVFHQGRGAGLGSLAVLKRLALKPEIAEHVQNVLADLPDDYVSIHVRCTDLKVCWEDFLKSHASLLEGRNVVLCSDNPDVKRSAAALFSASTQVLSTVDLPETKGRSLHMRGKYRGTEQYLLDLFVDLFALAGGRECIYPLARNPKGRAIVSGFSRLAEGL